MMSIEMNAARSLQDSSDEIDVLDLWRTMVKHKIIILTMPVLTMLMGVGYLVYTPALFESRAVIHVGLVGHVGQAGQIQQVYIEQPEKLAYRLKEAYRQMQVSNGPGGSIVLYTQNHTAAEAQHYLHTIAQDLLAEHAKLYSEMTDMQHERLHSLATKHTLLSGLIQKLPELDENVLHQPQALTMAIEKGKLFVDIANMDEAYTKLKIALSDLYSSPTRIASEPTLASVPISPKPRTVLAVALIIGGILGVLSAFFAEFLSRLRSRLREQKIS